MRHACRIVFANFCLFLLLSVVLHAQQPWSGIISTPRATNWSLAGLPGDTPPDSSWAQCGAAIAAYGSSSSYASPSTIQSAINNCGANEYVLLGAGDFYLTGGVSLKSNVVLRGSGANQTRVHVSSAQSCNGISGLVCIVGSTVWSGSCSINVGGNTYSMWSCPSGTAYASGWQYGANWTSGYSQGAATITLDNVNGIVVNQTPIVLDQCDTGFTGSAGTENCTGTAGVITSASVYSGGGGSGYAVGDTGKIICGTLNGRCYGGYNATYKVTSVSSGAVTGFSIVNSGSGYTYTNTGSGAAGTPTIATSGSGSGFLVNITGVSSYDNGSIFSCAIEMICSYESDGGTSRPARTQAEVVIATSISGSGPYTVTLNHPLMHPNWSSVQSPQAWWGSSTISHAGVENLMMDVSQVSASCVVMQTASYIWVTGVSCSTANYLHVNEYVVSNTLVSNSYFYWTKNVGTESYGLGSAGAVALGLYENNILQGIVDPLVASGTCAGCVFAYNFSVNDYDAGGTSFLFASSPMHQAGTDYILEEGNIGAGADQDSNHGPHFMNTYFRNYFDGYEPNNGTMPQYSTIPAIVQAFSRYNNYLANVLGTSGYHKVYQCVPSSSTQHYCATDSGSAPGNVHIWDIGFSSIAQIDYTNSPAEPNDLLTASSLYRYGNYDVVNGSVQWNSSEVPTSDPNFPNPVPNGNVFPSTLYNGVTGPFPSCGTGLSFWYNPTTKSCPSYPNIGPDVAKGDIGMCTSGTYKWSRVVSASQCAGGSFSASVNGGYGNSNPAMRCYLNQMSGSPNGTGSMLTFNPAGCYAIDTAETLPPPVNVNGSVNATPNGSQ